MSFEKKSESKPVDKLDQQRDLLIKILEADFAKARLYIDEAPERRPDKHHVDASDAFSADTLQIIRQIFRENDTSLLETLETWLADRLGVVISQNEGDYVLKTDPRLFIPDRMNDGTGE